MCEFESRLRHHKEIKGLGFMSLPFFCGGFWVGVIIGVIGVRIFLHQLLSHSASSLKPIIKLAHHTGMRLGEILGLTWGQMDLKEGFIHLGPEDCKTNEGRLVPLNQEMVEMFKAMPRGLPGVAVFTRNGSPGTSIREAFTSACQKAGIGKANNSLLILRIFLGELFPNRPGPGLQGGGFRLPPHFF